MVTPPLWFRAALAMYAIAIELVVWAVLVPATLARMSLGRAERRDLFERLSGARLPAGRRVLVHAVSAGEMVAAAPLVERLAPRAVVLSTQTAAGEVTAALVRTACPHVEQCVFLPWDRPSIGRWLDASGITAVIVLETEIWPNLFTACRRRGIPLFIANGHIRDGDAQRYRLARPFFRQVLESVTWIGVQTSAAREAFLSIGAPADRIEIGGNLKLDASVPARPLPRVVKAALGTSRIIVAGSTHYPEEGLLIECIVGLRQRGPIRLVVAPRDVRRAAEIERHAAIHGLRAARISGGADGASAVDADADVLIVDRYGWLRAFYQSADIIFVGGTIAPIGGHNIAEAAAAGRPVIIGPHVADVAALVEALERGEGVVRLLPHPTADTLREACRSLLDDPDRARRIGLAGRSICERSSGAVDRYCSAVLHRIPAVETPAG